MIGAWVEAAEIVAAGKARYIGWSNVRTWPLERIRALAGRGPGEHLYRRPKAGVNTWSIVDDECCPD
jgi:aryl-alcohol dehydrogenase-like predicted oxidoreductase